MKKLLCVLTGLLLTIPVHADSVDSPDQAYDYTTVGRDLAGVYWSSKNCMGLVLNGSCLTTPPDSRFFSPTVVIFNGKSGSIVKHIKFFDDTCPYIPVSLTGFFSRVTLVVRVPGVPSVAGDLGSGVGADLIGADMENNYPDCQYFTEDGVTLTETRIVRNGRLLYNNQLQDINSYAFE